MAKLPATYDISPVLVLVPTVDCLRLLRNLRWGFRYQPSGASLFAQVSDAKAEPYQPIIPIDHPQRLTFWLEVRDRHFTNYTNLPLANHGQRLYYFSNLWNNQGGETRFLTRPLVPYATNTDYPLGKLVIHNNQTLESLQPQSSTDTAPDPALWDILPASQYVSESDRLRRQGRYYTGAIAHANRGDRHRLLIVDSNGQESFAETITVPDHHITGEDLPIHLNLVGLVPGRYQLRQDGILIDEFVFIDTSEAPSAFGLVEILLNPDLIAPAFSLLRWQDEQAFIQPQTYVIRFKNRSTRWRYRYQQPHGCTASTLPATFTLIDAYTYATTRPIGLRQQPNALLNGCRDKPLPVPGDTLIKPELNGDHQITQIFSDVYL